MRGRPTAPARLNGIPLVTTTYTQATTDPTLITTTASGPFKVVLSFGGVSLTQLVNLTADKSLVFGF